MSLSDKKNITTIALDADDTLWRNEEIFMEAQGTFIELLEPYHDKSYILSHLEGVQVRNLRHFGYGIKGFTLSMIETAIELTEGRISGHEIHQIIQLAKNMVSEPVTLLPHVQEVVEGLRGQYQLMVITKGDLLDQESKLARSGIADWFDLIEIVSDKTEESYRQILSRYQIPVDQFIMVGNSLKSDVLPVLDLGASAIHIPYHSTWVHEQVDDATLSKYKQLVQLTSIAELPSWLHS